MFIFNHGILGINARNLLYLKPYNPKIAVKLADDKIKTKQFLQARGVPVPRLIARISSLKDLEKFDWNILPSNFVLKPNTGYGGEGILVIKSRKERQYRKINDELLDRYDLENHIESILAGRYSITNTFDTAFFEQRLLAHEFFGKFTDVGLPDVRIVLHNLIPVMAMLRIPTHESDGKANVHLGGIGIGIDISKGVTTYAVQYDRLITDIPGFGKARGHKIPFWQEMLLIASRLQHVTNLGYLACDLVIDKTQGPVLLELNARAGLMVQIANLSPLRKRLERIKGIKVNSPEKGVRIGQDLFGQKIENDTKQLFLDKTVIGLKHNIEILIQQGGMKTVAAKIAPDQEKSQFSEKLIAELSEVGGIKQAGEDSYKVKFNLADRKIQTIVLVGEKMATDVVIGYRDLNDFLIDPRKTYVPIVSHKNKLDLSKIDRMICDIDSKIKLVAYLKPVNLDEEKSIFLVNKNYNPTFEYRSLEFDPDELLDRLKYIETDSSEWGKIFSEKKNEIEYKIKLLKYRGDNDYFTEASLKLFPKPGLRFVRLAIQANKESQVIPDNNEDLLTDEEAKDYFSKLLEDYKMHDCRVQSKRDMVVDCSVSRKGVVFVKEGAIFTRRKLEQLRRHEIDTHIVTALNGVLQTYQIFKQGTAKYLLTQEGMAIYNQTHFVDGITPPLGWGLLAVHFALEGSFSETFHKLYNLGIPEDMAFRTTVKVKRGLSDTSKAGGFTKESIYFQGYHLIKDYLDQGGDYTKLYVGKISLADLPILEKIIDLRPPKYLPDFLQ